MLVNLAWSLHVLVLGPLASKQWLLGRLSCSSTSDRPSCTGTSRLCPEPSGDHQKHTSCAREYLKGRKDSLPDQGDDEVLTKGLLNVSSSSILGPQLHWLEPYNILYT